MFQCYSLNSSHPHPFAIQSWNQIPWSSFSECWMLSQLFNAPLSTSSRCSLVPLYFLPLMWCHLHLMLLMFLPAIFIPACDSPSPAFHIMYSAYKLNKQSDNIQSWHIIFPILSQSIVPCLVLTAAFSPAYRFLRWQVRWYGIPIPLIIFHSLLWFT